MSKITDGGRYQPAAVVVISIEEPGPPLVRY
jgi:hypothetical protein